jgi:hypothetical protein
VPHRLRPVSRFGADPGVNLHPVQVIAKLDLLVELRGGQRAPVVFLARCDARHVVGQDQDADAGARCGGRCLFDR